MLSSFGRQKKLVDDRNYKKLQNGFSGIPINSKFFLPKQLKTTLFAVS